MCYLIHASFYFSITSSCFSVACGLVWNVLHAMLRGTCCMRCYVARVACYFTWHVLHSMLRGTCCMLCYRARVVCYVTWHVLYAMLGGTCCMLCYVSLVHCLVPHAPAPVHCLIPHALAVLCVRLVSGDGAAPAWRLRQVYWSVH